MNPSYKQNPLWPYAVQQGVRIGNTFLSDIHSADALEQQKPDLRRQFMDMLGLGPDVPRTELNTTVTGTVDRSDVGFRIEKLHFQSIPGLYVTGCMYIPEGAGPFPAILYVNGHGGSGERSGGKAFYQQHALWFASRGYVCLHIDTLLYGEIPDGIHHGLHHMGRSWWISRGYTPCAVECLNGLRAMDVLAARPEVDTERIGVTGRSGGAGYSMNIAALDERVAALVPVSGGGVFDIEDLVSRMPGGCDCTIWCNTYEWPRVAGVARLIAPRPIRILYEGLSGSTVDVCLRVRKRLEQLYGLYGEDVQKNNIDVKVLEGGHASTPQLRAEAREWLNRHLSHPCDAADESAAETRAEKLRVFPADSDLPADSVNHDIDRCLVLQADLRIPEPGKFNEWRTDLIHKLRKRPFAALGETHIKCSGFKQTNGFLSVDPPLGVSWQVCDQASSRRHWLVLLDRDHTAGSLPEWAAPIIQNETAITLGVRGTGHGACDTDGDWPERHLERALLLSGQTLDLGRVRDVIIAARAYRRQEPEADIALFGRSRMGMIGAYAALFSSDIDELTLIAPPGSHMAEQSPQFPGILRVLDIPVALGLLAPCPLRLITECPDNFEPTVEIYTCAGAADALRIEKKKKLL